MVDSLNNTHKVVSGECAWNVAKANLTKGGGKISNSDIVKEMKRLAELNGCDSIDDFNKKFFSTVGKEFMVAENSTNKPENGGGTPVNGNNDKVNQEKQRESAPVDSSRVKGPETAPADSTRVSIQNPVEPPAAPKSPKEKEIERINNLPDDTSRIIEYNKKNYDHDYYGIVDKKTCELKIYDRDGNVVETITVGVGKAKGDNLQSGYLSKNRAKKEAGRYTTPGEFTLDEYSSYNNANYISNNDGKHKVMALKGDNRGEESGQAAIHMIPNNRSEREVAMDTPTVNDNRMSYGCVNLREEDYNLMATYLGEGNKIYILPEEQGNKLLLEQQSDGSYKFEQQYHKEQKRGMAKELASRVNYDVKPENNPKFIAEQKQQKAEEERLLAEQQKRDEVVWYNPFTWFS